MNLFALVAPLLLLILPAAAQFQFFDHVFNQGGGRQQQQQGPQQAGSDSVWYQERYEAGEKCLYAPNHDSR